MGEPATATGVRASTDQVLADYDRSASPSARVLLTTIFGDAILPRRRAASVAALATLAQPLGINERAVRTALQRLSTEQLVSADRVGRHSFYRVHPDAVPTFEQANRRIYQRPRPSWDGQWTIAVLDAAEGAEGERLAQELRWLGLAPVEPGVLVSATVTPAEVIAVAGPDGAGLTALTRGLLDAGSLTGDEGRRRLVDPDGALDKLYRRHLETFAPALDIAADAPGVDAFVLRTLAVDSWRRIALRAAEVPPALEPTDWLAEPAFELTAELLAQLRSASDRHLDEVLGRDPDRP
ncbi:MAG: PaaX family transcriptional regulator C-terminal domain-containing protein [Actinomycetota bacterium]